MSSSTKLQKGAKLMKREFTTNWYIYRACLHSIPSKPDLQHNTSTGVCVKEISPLCNHEFNKLVLEAVDAGLSSLGDSPKQAIYFYLEKAFKIKRSEIPGRIEEFANALEQIFGHGAKLVEIQIMKLLYEKVEQAFVYFPEKDDLLFTEYMEAARLSNDSN
jgi:hypothetical protein